ncbi:class I SAM-dependent methyltransferase [Anianabacter salinae]|uniref:class I SAM-dependent methyltransferase n=1 Tax=Anianabacter salinae TaxID=2851023 RepID=UPI00225DDA42|nr:class I SAM-dependent methyltransferase [Anianabacter salinae]MBV0913025.1 class I SAM-dependent methyltransferase [Anianabacter salinae]
MAQTLPVESGFRPAAGMIYARYLKSLHQGAPFDWYLEIGCRKGNTFAGSRSKTIAVDPYFQVDQNVITQKPALHVFQQTSDDFFASGFLKAIKAKLSFSFLDGMHLFEFLLRDIINTEAHSRADGIIALHDCIPFDHAMTTRDLDNLPSRAWTGDVWKILPILRQYRPKMQIDVLDCQPSGLVLLSGLKPSDKSLSKAYDQIVADWADVTLQDYGLDRFYDQFEFVDARADRIGGFQRFSHLRLDETEATRPEYITP